MSKGFQFSNFQDFDQPMLYQGMRFESVETFYQAMKTESVEKRREISLMTASQAKKAGSKLTIRKDWEDIKLKVMEYALRYKFTPGTSHYSKLMETDGKIVEDNLWHDNFWGVCYCGALTSSPYGKRNCTKGKNHLGILLMKIRDELRQEAQ